MTNGKDFTMVVETMSHDRSICIRPNLPPYTIENQTVTFNIKNWKGNNGNIPKTLYHWKSHLGNNEEHSSYFNRENLIHVSATGSFTIHLDINTVHTFTTLSTGHKGNHGTPPAPKSFLSILPYHDNFNSYPEYSEARYFADQTGSFEIFDTKSSSHSKVLRQTVLQPVIAWCGASSSPISIIGTRSMTDFNVTIEAMIENGFSNGHVVIGGRTSQGGCTDSYGEGYYLSVYVNGEWSLTRGGNNVMQKGRGLSVGMGNWFRIGLEGRSEGKGGVELRAEFNGVKIAEVKEAKETWSQGWASIGSGYNHAQFDNFYLSIPK
eukprot:TRINITY_DN3388_c0_g2_i2.p1 TRINITY_DN3388_c0_g2~~TRINITY_DN3388_c0_g2_i2.p1  ORF type:complete len:321 (-),score=72.35 TRINITY_DN3388_c0_g2_i2:92-1054(-)